MSSRSWWSMPVHTFCAYQFDPQTNQTPVDPSPCPKELCPTKLTKQLVGFGTLRTLVHSRSKPVRRRDTEEIVCIREEAHACYDDCLEIVKLCSCRVKRWKNFQRRHLVRYSKSSNTKFLKKKLYFVLLDFHVS